METRLGSRKQKEYLRSKRKSGRKATYVTGFAGEKRKTEERKGKRQARRNMMQVERERNILELIEQI